MIVGDPVYLVTGALAGVVLGLAIAEVIAVSVRDGSKSMSPEDG